MTVMDQYTRRIIGFAVHKGDVCGADASRMLNSIIAGGALPKIVSTDNDPIFKSHRWETSLGILEIDEIKSIYHF